MEKLKVFSPYDGSLVGQLTQHNAKDLEAALTSAFQITDKLNGKILPPVKRMEILEKAAQLVEQRKEELAIVASKEGGKPLTDSRVELNRAVQGIQEAARSIKLLAGREVPMNLNAASADRLAFTFREPIGVVAAISAFNHPFNLIVHQAVTAVAAGCPVIVKPANKTPLSCANLLEILFEAGLPKNYAQMLCLDNSLAERLATDKRVAYLSFIGSARVGWYLRSKLAPGARCALEHGGVAPVIVNKDAPVDAIIAPLSKGGFYHAGQVCVSVQRIFVHEEIWAELTEKLTAAAEKLVVGDPLKGETEVGPIINADELKRIDAWVKEAASAGGKIACGGKTIASSCYAPTVILNPPDSCRVSKEEVFGPVICLYKFSQLDDAVRRANALPYSFQAAVFSKDIDVSISLSKKIDAAAVMINDHTAFRVDWMPFAGRKMSGLGVGGILPSMLEMTEEKLIIIKSHPT